MEFSFLEKLFKDINTNSFDENIELVNFTDFDTLKLYSLYSALKTKNNSLLLPFNFIDPRFQPLTFVEKQQLKVSEFILKIVESGYEKVEQVYQEMQFSQKGDVFTLYTNISNYIYRIEFFGDEIEKISRLDNISFRQIHETDKISILNLNPTERDFQPEFLGGFDNSNTRLILSRHAFNSDSASPLSEHESSIRFKYPPLFHKNAEIFRSFASKYTDFEFYYSGHFWDIIPEGFKKAGLGQLKHINLALTLEKGIINEQNKVILLTDREILSTLNLSKTKSKKSSKFQKFFDNEVNVGDFIVHEAHGIGVYNGIETKIVLGEVHDYAIVEYQNEDKLLVPLEQLGRLSKYVSSEGNLPKLTKLGTAEWEAVKRKLKKNVEDIAKELLELYAKKNLKKGIKFDKDNEEQIRFEAAFQHKLTDDQLKSLNEVKDDMESTKPMDRLIIGDVGFGKTEVALRAAFKAVQSGKQVLLLAPTTVLVTQLYDVFQKRLHLFKFKVSRVSRFDGPKKNKLNVELANNGKVDVLIGTHRLLSNDVSLPNLGLLVIDEEQRFGVKQKEKIRKMRLNIDLLSMSATPIPRTLQMALTGIKDISIIATPPAGRLPVHNEVIFAEEVVEKIIDEVKRGGQVFVVHNKVQDLDSFVSKVREKLADNIKIAVGHGQMSGEKLEKIMFEFQEKVYDVLVATTIIENGIDIPSVNTIIIDNAQNFGLSQLYQLRGRVGRSDVQGFCYLTLPKTREFIELHKKPDAETRNYYKLLQEHKVEDTWITPDAVSRIQAILDNQELGAGFKIASRDLEIRGSGNILGSEQSGQINAVGYEMYVRLLEQEIDRIRLLEKTTLNIPIVEITTP